MFVNVHHLLLKKQAPMGNGTHLATTAISTLEIVNTTFASALPIPQLAGNVVSDYATPLATIGILPLIELRSTSDKSPYSRT